MNTHPLQSGSGSSDVAVIGGGPAGAVLAAFLTEAGHHVAIFEQSSFPRYHVGESLIPNTYGVFARLGLLPKLRQSPFPVKQSVRFVSRDGRNSAPFYFYETISGERARTWQVDRGTFDQLLLDHGRERGAEVRHALVERVTFEGNKATGLVIREEGQPARPWRARVIVDASGRACVLGRQLNLKSHVPGLRKAAAWGYYRGGQRLPGVDAGETTIFLIPGSGWFWYIPLPEDTVSVGLVADPEYIFDDGDDLSEAFLREVTKCRPLSARLAAAERVGQIRGLRQLAYANRQTCGDGWVMLGDARAFLDPIYSSGLFLALTSAELAAPCLDEALRQDDLSARRLGQFEPALWQGVEVIRRLIHAFYDPGFSFPSFIRRFPGQKGALVDCLIGDVIKDMSGFTGALAQMTPPPPPLHELLTGLTPAAANAG